MDPNQLLDLRKQKILDLKKSRNMQGLLASVILVIDRSGSMNSLYNNGTVQATIARLTPLGLAMDDNQSIDCYAFHDTCQNVGDINRSNYQNFTREVLMKTTTGGTQYAPAIRHITSKYSGGSSLKKGLAGFFGRKVENTPKTLEFPVYVIYITDGENSDREETKKALIEASEHGIFWQFVGIGRENFRFLTQLDTMPGRKIDNANFFQVPDLNTATDDDLYSLLLAEFPTWLPLARHANLIP